jgi:nickel transport protein
MWFPKNVSDEFNQVIRGVKMFLQKIKTLLIAAAILPCFIQPASAHVVWFDYNNGEYEVLFGHPEDGPEPYETSRFKEAIVYDANKQILPFDLNQKQDALFLTAGKNVAAIQGFFDNGYFATLSNNESLRITEEEIPKYDNVGHYLKYTKAFYDWSDDLAKPFNLPLEILPLQNPLAVTPGESLLVQVLSEGKPITDAVTVEYLGQVVAKNLDGTFSIPITQEGLEQPIEASYSLPSNGNLAVSYETSLTVQNISVPEPSALLGLGFVGLLVLYNNKKKLLVNK